jgi:hypothetical protein
VHTGPYTAVRVGYAGISYCKRHGTYSLFHEKISFVVLSVTTQIRTLARTKVKYLVQENHFVGEITQMLTSRRHFNGFLLEISNLFLSGLTQCL